MLGYEHNYSKEKCLHSYRKLDLVMYSRYLDLMSLLITMNSTDKRIFGIQNKGLCH